MGRWMSRREQATPRPTTADTVLASTSPAKNDQTTKVATASVERSGEQASPPRAKNDQTTKGPEGAGPGGTAPSVPAASLSARLVVNRGVLMTVGMCHGYPLLPLKPGVSIAEGDAAWRTFTRCSDDAMLTLAVEAARASWGDDLMTRDLIYVEQITAQVGGDDPGARSGCRPDSRPSPENDDPIHEACRDHERRQDWDDR